jgi:hypothetical protein
VSGRGKLILRFGKWTAAYGISAFVLLAITALRTCGMTPDSVELCNLTALTFSQIAVGLGYVALAIYFYCTRVSGRL